MSIETLLHSKIKCSDLRFKKLGDNYIVTNIFGEFLFINERYFSYLIKGQVDKIPIEKLNRTDFTLNNITDDQINKYASRNSFLFNGPSLHIIIATLRCDHRCIYCQASSKSKDMSGWDMSRETAKEVVDCIFNFPSKDIVIEFQGGEPLLNFKTVSFVIDYALSKNKSYKKKLVFSLVSNFSFMNNQKLKFFMDHDVSLCTSLDGPEEIHNKNRTVSNKELNSYRNTTYWIKELNKMNCQSGYKYKVSALTTITKSSLTHAKDIVDEFLSLGLHVLHLRPINPFGAHKKNIKDSLGFTSEVFIEFYREALDYIIRLNLEGKKIVERTALIFLKKIFSSTDPNYMDLRSPCGAGVGQLAYNYNGDVYSCDEGRMLSAGSGDELFRLGNVFKDNLNHLIDNETVKSLSLASCLDNVPKCVDCVYKPYCGICPIYNYSETGNIFSCSSNQARCKINSGILDYIFNILQSPLGRVFNEWVDSSESR